MMIVDDDRVKERRKDLEVQLCEKIECCVVVSESGLKDKSEIW